METTAVDRGAAGPAARALERALGTAPPPADAFDPAFLRRYPLWIVAQTVAAFLDRHGPLVAVERDGDRWRAVYERGEEPVQAALTPEGLIRGLLIGPRAAGDVDIPERPLRAVDVRRRVACDAAAAILLPPVVAAGVWSTGSLADWALLAALGALLLATSALLLPWWVVGAPLRRPFVGACAVAAAASASRLPRLPRGPLHWWLVALLVAAGVPTLARLRGRRARRPVPEPLPLRLPLAGGRFCVIQGGGPAVNAHAATDEQRHALDLVRLGRLGGRCSPPAVYPGELERYAIWDTPVVAPCEGTVVRAVDGVADLEPPGLTSAQPAGNHLLIETGVARVLLAHLRCGSLLVAEGERVHAGQPLGRVGSSGNSSEPHLHVHAERDGLGVPLAFAEARSRQLRRNDVVAVR